MQNKLQFKSQWGTKLAGVIGSVILASMSIAGASSVKAAAPATVGLVTVSGNMNGNLPVNPGDVLAGGYDFTMPSGKESATVNIAQASVTVIVDCPDGSSQSVVVTLPNESYAYTAGSNTWLPSSDQTASSTLQGSVTTSTSLCGGQTGYSTKGTVFTAFFTSNDTTDKIKMHFHYANVTTNSVRGWSGDTMLYAVMNAQPTPTPSPSRAYVYFTDPSANKIDRANLDGTNVVAPFVSGANSPVAVVVSNGYLYWTNAGNGTGTTIGRAATDGTGVNENFITGANEPVGLAVNSSSIYWTNRGNNTIGHANLDGTGVNQSFITATNEPGGVAVDANYVYYTNQANNSIGRANLDGTGANEFFISNVTNFLAIAVNSNYIYFNDGAGNVDVANLNGTGVTTILQTSFVVVGLALDSSYLYYSPSGFFQIGRANLDGTNPNSSFITTPDQPYGVSVG